MKTTAKTSNGLMAHLLTKSGRSKKPLALLQSGREKGKPDISHPWVGSYFGIPEPEQEVSAKPTSYTTCEAEIHILLKNMQVEKFTIQTNWPHHSISKDGIAFLGMVDEQEVSMPLKELAWKREDALAFVIYHTYIDSRTGVRRLSKHVSRWMKTSKYVWHWFDETTKGEPFVPDVVKMRHPHVFSCY